MKDTTIVLFAPRGNGAILEYSSGNSLMINVWAGEVFEEKQQVVHETRPAIPVFFPLGSGHLQGFLTNSDIASKAILDCRVWQ